MPSIWYKIKCVFPHEHLVNHRNTENKAGRDIIRSVSPPFFLKAKINYSKKDRTWKLAFILMCRCLSLFFMLWWQRKEKQNGLNPHFKATTNKIYPSCLRLLCKILQITAVECEGCTKNEEYPYSERNDVVKWVICQMLWAQAGMNPLQKQSEKLTMAHKSKAEENISFWETEIKHALITGHIPCMRERNKWHWVVPKIGIFKLLLKHDRVDTRTYQFYSIYWEDPYWQLVCHQRDKNTPYCQCTEAGEEPKLRLDVHVYQVHWSHLPAKGPVLSSLKYRSSAVGPLPGHSTALRLIFTRLPV